MPHTPIAINCPKCGRLMQFLSADDPSGTGIQIYECPEHGLYHFGRTIDPTAGPPPEQ